MKHQNDLIKFLGKLKYSPDAETRERILKQMLDTMGDSTRDGMVASPQKKRKTGMKSRIILATAAAILITLGLTFLWPSGDLNGSGWWKEPPKAWADKIMASLQAVEVLIYREQMVFVSKYGSTHTSANWSKWYKARDRLRMDKYYDKQLVQTKWELPQPDGLKTHYNVNHGDKCYEIAKDQKGRKPHDPVQDVKFYVSLLDRADRILDPKAFDGRQCIGFEISAARYGSNPEEWVDRIWFDVKTKMPVRIERHGRPITNNRDSTFCIIMDRFEYHARVPADLFNPEIPDSYVKGHPDDVRAKRDRETKEETAEIPEGLQKELMNALDSIKTVSYHEKKDRVVHLSRNAWRIQHFAGKKVASEEWYVIKKDDMSAQSYDFNDKGFRIIQTSVNHETGTFKKKVLDEKSRPGHPMDRIRFIINMVYRADKLMEDTMLEGKNCFGYVLSAKKYGTNPDHMIHRVWIDSATRLPVQFTFECLPDGASKKRVKTKNKFRWDPALGPGFFEPKIPEGFSLGS